MIRKITTDIIQFDDMSFSFGFSVHEKKFSLEFDKTKKLQVDRMA